MSGKSLGLIETVGLAAAVEAADAALKSANVELVSCEQTKGGGLMLVTLAGEVGAVNAAVAAGVAAASRVSRVYACKVIARTAEGLTGMIQRDAATTNAVKAVAKANKDTNAAPAVIVTAAPESEASKSDVVTAAPKSAVPESDSGSTAVTPEQNIEAPEAPRPEDKEKKTEKTPGKKSRK